MGSRRRIFRAAVLHFKDDPAVAGEDNSYEYFDDGVLIVKDGFVEAVGEARDLLPTLPPDLHITHYRDCMIIPGFVDCHVHYPQTEIVAAYGEQLLEWLERYTFPTEREFASPAKASKIAEFFLDELPDGFHTVVDWK